MGFKRLESDPCVYILLSDSGGITVLGAYVDDIFLFGTDHDEVSRVKDRLKAVFRTKDLGRARWALGMAIHQNGKFIEIDQKKYLGDVLNRFETYHSKRKANPRTPLPAGLTLVKARDDEDTSEAAALPYRELIGSLMYLAVGSRPDIAFDVSMLSRFVSKHNLLLWKAALHVLRYRRGRLNVSIRFDKRTRAVRKVTEDLRALLETGFFGYVDSDFATDPSTSRSISGQIFMMNGGPVSWRSKQQPLVTTSTSHAEYVAGCEAARECVWIREFF